MNPPWWSLGRDEVGMDGHAQFSVGTRRVTHDEAMDASALEQPQLTGHDGLAAYVHQSLGQAV